MHQVSILDKLTGATRDKVAERLADYVLDETARLAKEPVLRTKGGFVRFREVLKEEHAGSPSHQSAIVRALIRPLVERLEQALGLLDAERSSVEELRHSLTAAQGELAELRREVMFTSAEREWIRTHVRYGMSVPEVAKAFSATEAQIRGVLPGGKGVVRFGPVFPRGGGARRPKTARALSISLPD
jgi:hypothetical protein